MSPTDPGIEVVSLGGAREVSLPFKRALANGELSSSSCRVQGFEVYAPRGTKLSPEQELSIQEAILDVVKERAREHSTVNGLRSWLDSGNGSIIRLNGRNVFWKRDSLRVSPL